MIRHAKRIAKAEQEAKASTESFVWILRDIAGQFQGATRNGKQIEESGIRPNDRVVCYQTIDGGTAMNASDPEWVRGAR